MTREARRTLVRQRDPFRISGFTPAARLTNIAADSAEAARLDALRVRQGGQVQSMKARGAAAWKRQTAENAKPERYLGIGWLAWTGLAC